MRITEARVVPREIPITVPYRIAGRTFETAEIIVVALRDEKGTEGYGTASPVPPLTGDDFASAVEALRDVFVPAVTAGEIRDVYAAIDGAASAAPHARSALAAIDIALHDLAAKRAGVPLVEMLGGRRRRLFTSVTIGIDDPARMLESARRHAAKGFKAIKVKIGESAREDVRALRMIREAVGPGVALRVDANQGYTAAQAIEVARELESLEVELFEQPVSADDLEAMAAVTRATRLPVLADEAMKVSMQVPDLVEAGAARGANIKLMKCGGVLEARRIDAALAQAGWSSLIGCMDESRASIAAAAHFAAASETARWIDLDGHFDLAEDPFEGGVDLIDGELVLGPSPGLGVRPARIDG